MVLIMFVARVWQSDIIMMMHANLFSDHHALLDDALYVFTNLSLPDVILKPLHGCSNQFSAWLCNYMYISL